MISHAKIKQFVWPFYKTDSIPYKFHNENFDRAGLALVTSIQNAASTTPQL